MNLIFQLQHWVSSKLCNLHWIFYDEPKSKHVRIEMRSFLFSCASRVWYTIFRMSYILFLHFFSRFQAREDISRRGDGIYYTLFKKWKLCAAESITSLVWSSSVGFRCHQMQESLAEFWLCRWMAVSFKRIKFPTILMPRLGYIFISGNYGAVQENARERIYRIVSSRWVLF